MSEIKTRRDYFEQVLVEKYPQLTGHLKQNKEGVYCNTKVKSLYQGFMLALKCDARIDDIPTRGRYVIGHTLKREDDTFGWSFSFKPVRHYFLNNARAEQKRLAKAFPKSSFTLFKIVSVVDGEESPFKFPVIQKETPQEVADENAVILSTTVLEQNGLVNKDGEEFPKKKERVCLEINLVTGKYLLSTNSENNKTYPGGIFNSTEEAIDWAAKNDYIVVQEDFSKISNNVK